MPDSQHARYVRARARTRARHGEPEQTSFLGHGSLHDIRPAAGLASWPDGGGYPVGFLTLAYRLMGVYDVDAVLHVCSGSVQAKFTLDVRPAVRPAVVGDARHLPFLDESFDFVLADPPYDVRFSKEMYGISARKHPTPAGIAREAWRVLRPGGTFGLVHYQVPIFSAREYTLVAVYGMHGGPGTQIRAFTVLRKVAIQTEYVS